MKRLCIYSLFISMLLSLQSCFFSEKDVFDKSSSERQEMMRNACYQYLTGAPNGWLLEYYPGGEFHDIGGTVLLMSFSDDEVTVMSDTELQGEDDSSPIKPGESVTSKFKILGNQGTILSFSTYNTLIHYWSEPKGNFDTDGFMGDFEFIVLEASENTIIMKGMKNGTRAILSRMSEDITWSNYIASCNKIREESKPYKTLVGKHHEEVFANSAYSMENVITFSGKDLPRQKVSFVYTDQGIRLYEPVQINNILCYEFIWNNEKKTFVSTTDANTELLYMKPEDYVDIHFYTDNTWELYYSFDWGEKDTTEVVQFKRINESDTLLMKIHYNNLDFDLRAIYDSTTGMIEFRTQYLNVLLLTLIDNTNIDAYLYLCPWHDTDNIMFLTEKAGISSYTEQMAPRILKFKDNGLTSGYEVNGFVLYAFKGFDRASEQLGPLSTFSEITLKQRIEEDLENENEQEE